MGRVQGAALAGAPMSCHSPTHQSQTFPLHAICCSQGSEEHTQIFFSYIRKESWQMTIGWSICQMLLCPVTEDLAESFKPWMVTNRRWGGMRCCSCLLNPCFSQWLLPKVRKELLKTQEKEGIWNSFYKICQEIWKWQRKTVPYLWNTAWSRNIAVLTHEGTGIQPGVAFPTVAAHTPHRLCSYSSVNILLLAWCLNSCLELPGVCIDLEAYFLLYEDRYENYRNEGKEFEREAGHPIKFRVFSTPSPMMQASPPRQTSPCRPLPNGFS